MEIKPETHQYIVMTFDHSRVTEDFVPYIEEIMINYCKEHSKEHLIVAEYGSRQGSHYHLNVIIHNKTPQTNVSYTRTKLKKIYEENRLAFNKRTLHVKQCKEDMDRLFAYVFKEDACRVISNTYNIDPDEMKKKALILKQNTQDARRISRYNIVIKSQIMDTICDYMEDHQIEVNTPEDFKELIVEMRKNGIVMMEVISRPKHYYALLQHQDADYALMEILSNNFNLN